MSYKYYVVGRCYDNGKGKAEIITAEEAAEKGYINGLQEDRENYDLYVDGFDTEEEAREFARDY